MCRNEAAHTHKHTHTHTHTNWNDPNSYHKTASSGVPKQGYTIFLLIYKFFKFYLNMFQDSTDSDVKKVLALHLQPVAEFDAKYDSDSDFDYRQKPPR